MNDLLYTVTTDFSIQKNRSSAAGERLAGLSSCAPALSFASDALPLAVFCTLPLPLCYNDPDDDAR